MRRVLSIFLPLWPVERVARRLPRAEPRRGRHSSTAVLVVLTAASRQLVEHACHVAIRAGVVPGMSLAHARALLGNDLTLFTIPHEPNEDQRRLVVLARWAERWSPVVCVDPPDGILIDLTGTEHLFGGEAKMLSRIERSLRRFGLTARLGIASTVGTAWAVARYEIGRAHV